MAIFEEHGLRIARSPYGGSYGGPAFEKRLTYGESCEVVETLIEYLTGLCIGSCQITLPISCCYARYSETSDWLYWNTDSAVLIVTSRMLYRSMVLSALGT